MSVAQPSGTVTLVFTDVEGSTKLLDELGTDGYRHALGEHRRIVREAFALHDGYEVDYEGDAFFYAFASAPEAVTAVSEAMVGLKAGPIRIRVGIHTGEPALDPPKYVGMDVHRAARVMSAAHGGQVVLSPSTFSLLEPGTFELIDLGEHRLKDIEGATPIFQLGDGSFPPLKTISNTNLPRPASSFVGREAERDEVLARIEGGARLVTLTGPGGTGKTRLALEAAMSLVPEYKAGVFWVGLASLRDPALVTETISQALGAKDGLAEHIGERELLLLLDNLEQVIEAVPALSVLLQSCPNLTLLVTSRELLRISGEVEYPVPPLAETEAVALFCERARVEPSKKIAELCARLDNLPLAVELAAARVKVLSPAQILDRLSKRIDLLKGGRDADPRQQTLRATIEWSYDLLSKEEQQLFARLSVFAGSCTLEAAEEVCYADLDTLQSLVEKSLVRFTNERYWMLVTIADYARERLVPEDDALRARHAEYFAGHAEQAGRRESGGGDVLANDEPNLRLALEWSRPRERHDFVLRLLTGGRQLWLRGSHAELESELVDLLELSDYSERLRAEALGMLAFVAYRRGNYDVARTAGMDGRETATALGDASLIGRALNDLANVESAEGDFLSARARHERAGELFRKGGHRRLALVNAVNHADLLLMSGSLEEAVILCRETLLADEIEDRSVMETLHHNLAMGLALLGRHQEAIPHAHVALHAAAEADDRYMLTCVLPLVALIGTGFGDNDSGARLLHASDTLREEIGGVLEPTEEIVHRAATAAISAVHLPLSSPLVEEVSVKALELLDEWALRGAFPNRFQSNASDSPARDP